MATRMRDGRRGALLLEAIVAAGLLVVVMAGVLPLVARAQATVAEVRTDLMATHLVRQRLAQLHTLTYMRAGAAVVTDDASRLDGPGPFAHGGTGLTPTGVGPLTADAPTWVDWLDEHGAWQGSASPPTGAAYRRRWGVLAAGTEGCLRLWVEVEPVTPARRLRAAQAGMVRCPWGAAES